jgi:succinate dehydrogenase / fumarate reductase flavoprotein subunit
VTKAGAAATDASVLDPRIPEGPIQAKWDQHRFDVKLVNPSNRRKYDIIVIGTGLAGAGAAAALGELGYNVKAFSGSSTTQ